MVQQRTSTRPSQSALIKHPHYPAQGIERKQNKAEKPGGQHLTVVRFDLPGSREDRSAISENATTPINLPALSENERIAIDMAAKHGKATPKALASEAKISRKTASLVLKGLEEKGALRWSGKSAKDPYQFYELPS